MISKHRHNKAERRLPSQARSLTTLSAQIVATSGRNQSACGHCPPKRARSPAPHSPPIIEDQPILPPHPARRRKQSDYPRNNSAFSNTSTEDQYCAQETIITDVHEQFDPHARRHHASHADFQRPDPSLPPPSRARRKKAAAGPAGSRKGALSHQSFPSSVLAPQLFLIPRHLVPLRIIGSGHCSRRGFRPSPLHLLHLPRIGECEQVCSAVVVFLWPFAALGSGS